jgi:hypothetical protein
VGEQGVAVVAAAGVEGAAEIICRGG